MADWDINNPADDGIVSQYPANERDQREAVQTIFNEDHIQADGADQGKHRAVRLKSQGSDPGGVGAQGAIYTKTVGGLTELFFINGAGTVVQLTENGQMKAPLVDDLVTAAMLADNSVGSAAMQNNSVGNAELQAASVGTSELQDGALANSASGRLKMDAGFFNVTSQGLDKFSDGFWADSIQALAKFEDGFWSASSAARAKFGDGVITARMLSTGSISGSIAESFHGTVGTYALLRKVSASPTTMNPGDTIAGSNLRYSSVGANSGVIPNGTWRIMGWVNSNTDSNRTSLFLRIS